MSRLLSMTTAVLVLWLILTVMLLGRLLRMLLELLKNLSIGLERMRREKLATALEFFCRFLMDFLAGLRLSLEFLWVRRAIMLWVCSFSLRRNWFGLKVRNYLRIFVKRKALLFWAGERFRLMRLFLGKEPANVCLSSCSVLLLVLLMLPKVLNLTGGFIF